MLVTLIVWVRNPVGIAVVLIWSVALIALSRKGRGPASSFVLSLLAVQVALNSVFDIRVLFLLNGGRSDAADDGEVVLSADMDMGLTLDGGEHRPVDMDAVAHAIALGSRSVLLLTYPFAPCF